MGQGTSREVYDLMILGGGPAGITAAVYAARKKLDFLVVTLDIGGQAGWSGDIENYTGYQFITGPQLALKFSEHMDSFGIKVNMPEEATKITKEDDLIGVVTDKGRYRARTLIVASGKRPRSLDVAGEAEFKNKGVTYCATCDGPLFNGKLTAVIGGGNSAQDAALQLAKISPEVYVINTNPQLTGDAVMEDKLLSLSNVKVWNSARVKRIYGDKFVRGIEVERAGKEYRLDVEGVFVEIGLIPNSSFAQVLRRNDRQEIMVDCDNRTSEQGVFAAGDVTNVAEKQIIIACGEGAKACLGAARYLATHNFK